MEKHNYSKSVWLKRDTEFLLVEARVKFITENKEDKATADNIIKKALKVYVNGK